jgi:hypothetical protein
MNDLVDTTEMYLRTIYDLEEEGVTPLRARIAERLDQSGPTVSQLPARTRIPAAEPPGAPVECQPVQPAEQPQRQRQPTSIVVVAGENRGEDTAGCHVRSYPL